MNFLVAKNFVLFVAFLNGKAERHDFWSRFFFFILLFFFSFFYEGREKGKGITKVVVKSDTFLLDVLKLCWVSFLQKVFWTRFRARSRTFCNWASLIADFSIYKILITYIVNCWIIKGNWREKDHYWLCFYWNEILCVE